MKQLLFLLLCIGSLLVMVVQCNVQSEDPAPRAPDLASLEKLLKNVTKSAVKRVLPTAYRIMENVNVSSGCLSSLLKYAVALRQIKVWAMRMLDASAKIPSGILDGTVTEFGAFDQCLAILVKNRRGVEDFRGQYCSVEMIPHLGPRPSNLSLAVRPNASFDESIVKEMQTTIFAFYQLTLRFGICVPSTCSAVDMQTLGDQAIKSVHYKLRISKCHASKEVEIEVIHVVVMTIISLLVIMLIAGSALDYYRTTLNNKEPKQTTIICVSGTFYHILTAFSVQSNVQKLCSMKSRADEMKGLHGIRALSMTWVILGHTYIWVNFQALSKSSVASHWLNNIEFEVILNGWLSVSSFIFLSGLLTSYSTLQYMNKTGGKINVFLYTLRRFLRLYPAVLLVLGSMFFLPWLASGPFWPEMTGVEVVNCRQFWWTNLLFINNWMPISEMCMQHSWYVSADMQLHILALLVLLPLHKNSYAGLVMAFLLAFGGSLAVGLITYINDYDPTILISTANLPKVYKIVENIHIKTFTYFGPYCVGIVTGYLLMKHPKMKLDRSFKALGWCCACVLGLSSLYGTHKWNIGQFHSQEITATYAALHRTTFVIALAWVAYLCVTGNAGIVTSILKFRPFVLLSRLTFMTYLVQGPVIWTRYGSLKERIFYSHFNMLYEYMGNLIISLAIAFIGYVLVEAPFANLERLLFFGKERAVSKQRSSSTTLCHVKTCSSDQSKEVKPQS